MCGSVCLGLNKAHGDCDCCEAMHACMEVCVLVHKAHGQCDFCEAMHVFCRVRFCSLSNSLPSVCTKFAVFEHQDSSIDDLMFDFMNFVLCRNSTGWIIVW